MILLLRPDGRLEVIAHPETDRACLRALGEVRARWRTGWVEPVGPARWLFRLLRGPRVGRLRLARALSRRLPGPWVVRLPDGRVLGPFPTRAGALQAEEEAALAALLARPQRPPAGAGERAAPRAGGPAGAEDRPADMCRAARC